MGTSQSFKIKSSPNWSKAKRAMTHLSTPGNMTEANATRFLGHFGRAAGESRTFGRAGSATASNFIEFIGNDPLVGHNIIDFDLPFLYQCGFNPKKPKRNY